MNRGLVVGSAVRAVRSRRALIAIPAAPPASTVAAPSALTVALRVTALGRTGTGEGIEKSLGRSGRLGRGVDGRRTAFRIRATRFALRARAATAFTACLAAWFTAWFSPCFSPCIPAVAAFPLVARAAFFAAGGVQVFAAHCLVACRALGALRAPAAAFSPGFAAHLTTALATVFGARFAALAAI